MSEPETITLRRLPPEHVLRAGTDYALKIWGQLEMWQSGADMLATNVGPCYCRAEDYPPEYDKPAIDPGEGWRLLEPDELVQEGDEFWLVNAWDKSSNWFGSEQRQASGYTYRRRITPQPDRLTELRQQGERQAKRIEELEKQVKQLEATSQPLRWERRKPTEEECRERWIIERDETGTVYGWEPGEQPADEYHTMICVLPPIADAERRMVTQRRWLVNGPDGWQEEWPKDGEAPGSEWLEIIKTSRTREVPE